MKVPPASEEPLDALLAEEQRELEGFIALLEREQTVLTTGAIDRLQSVAEEKSGAFGRLARVGRKRSEGLVRTGITGSAGTHAALAALPETSPVRRRWLALRQSADRAQALNRQNGALIRLRLTRNHQALALLLSLSEQAATYGPNGTAFAPPAARHIDIA